MKKKSKGMDMEGEGGKPSIGERELSTKASETVTNLNTSNTDLVHSLNWYQLGKDFSSSP